ncbi:MAG TPA: 23S rRNA (adenine(2503)-C(2))-methyltransferase RlmN [Candidatus Latescibacteria bacterium]|nr:23S rRNA (adenine(2503)-C(2))-methyltransferase RlmN [Candidatus Latescibacterota bacterium]
MLSTIPEESFDRASALAHPAVCAEKPDLKGFLPDELREFLARFGKEKYRTNQLLRWMHGKGVADFDQMTDLGKEFRSQLKAEARVECLAERHRAVSRDGQTTKLVLGLSDGRKIETVMMLDDGRRTVCVSSQAGCALGCRFCATGQIGFQRNLTVGEILDQIHHAARFFRARGATGEEYEHPVTNVVFMGMGEPLNNYEAVLRATKLSGLEMGLAISATRVTISTAGVVPMIYRLASDLPKVGLAISLNATTDEVRNSLMPINRKYPLKTLLDAARHMAGVSPRRRVTFEYALIEGTNDSDEDARRLAELVSGFPCKINLIPFNPVPRQPFRRPSQERIDRFHRILWERNLTVTVRWSKGDDIAAACGQLQASVPYRSLHGNPSGTETP